MTHAQPWTRARVAVDERPNAGPDEGPLEVRVERADLFALPAGTSPVLPVASTVVPTQVANPRRTTWRSLVQLLVVLAIAAPQLAAIVLEQWSPEWLYAVAAQVIAVHTALVRIMAIPGVNAWIGEHLPGLAPIPIRSVGVRGTGE